MGEENDGESVQPPSKLPRFSSADSNAGMCIRKTMRFVFIGKS
jgi:hypothetical protein